MPEAETLPPRSGLNLPLLIAGLAIAIGGVALVAQRARPTPPAQPKPLPTLSQVPAFELIDAMAHPFGRDQLNDTVWVATFFFTTCPTLCPIMMESMASVATTYKEQPDVHFVAITVNPEYDSPAILTAHAASYGADPQQWHFLTGTLAAIQELSLNGLKIGTKEDPINHSSYFVLVDQTHHIRGYYDGQDEAAVQRLTGDIRRLLDGTDL